MNNSTFTKYGNFNKRGDEFVITRLDTPKPWINYSWNRQLLVEIDQLGRGSASYRHENGERTNLIMDRRVFIKDLPTGEHWTLGWSPVNPADVHQTCRHGLGYTKLTALRDDVECSLTILSAQKDPVEMWEICVRNESQHTREVVVYPYVEFDLSGFEVYGGLENTLRSEVNLKDATICAINGSDGRQGTLNNCFMCADKTPDGIETSKRRFRGGCYANPEHPDGIHLHHLGAFAASNEPLVGVMQYELVMEPDTEVRLHICIGPFADKSEILPFRQRYLSSEAFSEEMVNWRIHIRCFGNFDVDLGDGYLTPLFNFWTKQQLSMLVDYSRGWTMGIRDTLQDAQAYCSLDPAKSRQAIINACRHQYRDGSTLRGYWPLDTNRYADGAVWLAFAVVDYIKETGDMDILEQTVPYFDEGQDTLYDHVINGLCAIYANPGEHGLTRVMFGDWNDSLNIGIGGKGESTWLSMALVWACRETAELADLTGDSEGVDYLSSIVQRLTREIQTQCWDGEWYLRGFTDAGSKVGSASCSEGRIFVEPQTWAILSGIAGTRASALESAMQEHLMTDYGMLICYPGFKSYDPGLGRISTLPAGWGENASAYCHVSAFKAVADCMRGDGDAALDTINRIIAANPRLSIDISGIEPYGYTNMFRGPEHPQAGQSLRSWYTGTVGWVFRCVTQWMLGIRPTYEGLIIDPVLPKEWTRVKMVRRFRGACYTIVIIADTNMPKEYLQVVVDGRPIEGKLIRASEYPGMHEVDVTVGVGRISPLRDGDGPGARSATPVHSQGGNH